MFSEFLLVPGFLNIPKFNANNVDLDQTQRSAASDLGLHYLHISLSKFSLSSCCIRKS